MTKTWEEVQEEMEAYRQSRQFKIDQFIYRVRHFFTAPVRWKRNIRHWVQRAKRGYSDSDAWNGDSFMAGQIAGILLWIVENGHGVAMSYADADNPYDTDVDVMVQRRDAEWRKYAAIFEEYSKEGVAIDEEWQAKWGGVLDKDMQDALQWLSKHFYEMWD